MVDVSRWHDEALGLLRIVAGFLFWQHGAQKLFGWFSGEPVDAMVSLMGLAGVLEFVGGFLIIIGLFTRPVAFILAGEMAVAYFTVHLPRGLWPINNMGEPAVLFCFIYLLLVAAGAGAFSVDSVRSRGKVQV